MGTAGLLLCSTLGAGCSSKAETKTSKSVPVLAATTAPIVDEVTSTEPVISDLATSTKLVALTFDDGPYGTSTAKILDILKEKSVHATFFIIGKNSLKFPQEVRRELAEGHQIGNHSNDHSMTLAKMTAHEFKRNLDTAEDAITSVSKTTPTLFRPPYGSLSETMKTVLRLGGYSTVLWNVDPEDWDSTHSNDQIVKSVVSAVKPGSIILMHDGRDTHVNYPRDNTIGALPVIIDQLRAKGYQFVFIDQIQK